MPYFGQNEHGGADRLAATQVERSFERQLYLRTGRQVMAGIVRSRTAASWQRNSQMTPVLSGGFGEVRMPGLGPRIQPFLPRGTFQASIALCETLDSRHPSVQRRAASACSQSLTLSPGALGSAAFARFRAIWRKPLPLLGFSVNPVFSWTASFPWLSVPRELAHKVSLCF